MDWRECIRFLEENGLHSRFSWPLDGWADFNCKPGVTVSDITGGIAWIWTYPADALIRLPAINTFLELDPLHVGGYVSSGITLVGAWLLLALLVKLRLL